MVDRLPELTLGHENTTTGVTASAQQQRTLDSHVELQAHVSLETSASDATPGEGVHPGCGKTASSTLDLKIHGKHFLGSYVTRMASDSIRGYAFPGP
jgi:hypothetical protein